MWKPARSRSSAISWSRIAERVLNPLVVRGQQHGAIAMGISGALLEEVVL